MLKNPFGKPLIQDPLAHYALLSEAILLRREHHAQPYDDVRDKALFPTGPKEGFSRDPDYMFVYAKALLAAGCLLLIMALIISMETNTTAAKTNRISRSSKLGFLIPKASRTVGI